MAAYCQGIAAYLAVAILLMSTSEARHPEITLRMLAKSPCQDHNTRLFTFLEHAKEEVCISSRILSLYALSNLIPCLPCDQGIADIEQSICQEDFPPYFCGKSWNPFERR